MKSLELCIPPPVVTLIFAGMIWGVALLTSSFNSIIPARVPIVIFLLSISIILGSAGVISFVRHATSIDPAQPAKSTHLVTSGVYRISRNPMYLGLLVGLLGWVTYLGSPFSIFLLIGYVAYMNRFQIKPEERILENLYGEKYRSFLHSTRRWI